MLKIPLCSPSELGHHEAYLLVSVNNIPAVKLYRAFGFEPLLEGPAEESRWQRLLRRLEAPRDLPRVHAIAAEPPLFFQVKRRLTSPRESAAPVFLRCA